MFTVMKGTKDSIPTLKNDLETGLIAANFSYHSDDSQKLKCYEQLPFS